MLAAEAVKLRVLATTNVKFVDVIMLLLVIVSLHLVVFSVYCLLRPRPMPPLIVNVELAGLRPVAYHPVVKVQE